MSCSEELKGSYTINNKTEFNKVIKAMVAAQQETIDTINKLVKEYKGKVPVRNRNKVDWNLVEQCCPKKWIGSYSYRRLVTVIDLSDWCLQRLIETAIKQRGKLPKVTAHTLDVNDMRIDFERQSFSIDVYEENHAVEVFNSQKPITAFWKALQQVKWQQRGRKDGGYCTYNCEYQDNENYQEFHGRIGNDMKDWVCARPF